MLRRVRIRLHELDKAEVLGEVHGNFRADLGVEEAFTEVAPVV